MAEIINLNFKKHKCLVRATNKRYYTALKGKAINRKGEKVLLFAEHYFTEEEKRIEKNCIKDLGGYICMLADILQNLKKEILEQAEREDVDEYWIEFEFERKENK